MAGAAFMIPAARLDQELVRRGGLYEFVKVAWAQVEPQKPIFNWHMEEICSHLEAVSHGQIRRLVINVPPGTGKSLTVSVFWPLWEWIHRPEHKYIFASFDASLARRDAFRAMKVLQSQWFIDRWGALLTDPKVSATDYTNSHGGFRFSTSVAGKVTGRHAWCQVVDDPIKPKDAAGGSTMTKKALRLVSDWWRHTMSSRLVDAKTSARVIVMQRLNEEDLAGEMIAEGGYEHLRLPMRYEASNPCRTSVGGDRRKVDGALLFAARFPESAVRMLEKDMGPNVAAAQLQQRPVPAGGGTFKIQDFRYWHHLPNVPGPDGRICKVLPSLGEYLQSWDMTFKKSDGSDYVAGGVWLGLAPEYYLIDLVCDRMSFTEAVYAVRAMSAKHPHVIEKIIEDAANGPAIQDILSREIGGIQLVKPMGGKEARANAISPLFSAGNVYLPHPALAPWVSSYIGQMTAFPRGVNDDMVDMSSQALLRLHGRVAGSFAAAMEALRNA